MNWEMGTDTAQVPEDADLKPYFLNNMDTMLFYLDALGIPVDLLSREMVITSSP